MQKLQQIKSEINAFLNSFWCPAFFAALLCISHLFNGFHYIFICYALISSFALVACKNMRPFLISAVFTAMVRGYYLMRFPKVWCILALVASAIVFVSFVYYFVSACSSVKKFKLGSMFWPSVLIVLGAALGGVAYKPNIDLYLHRTLPAVLIVGAGLIVLYLTVLNFMEIDPNDIHSFWNKSLGKVESTNSLVKKQSNRDFVFTLVLFAGIYVCFGIFKFYVTAPSIVQALTNKDVKINGRINSYAPFLFFASVACLYFSAKSKHSWAWCIGSIVLYIFLLLTYSRAVIFISVLLYPMFFVYTVVKSKNKKAILISFAASLVVIVSGILIFNYCVFDLFTYLKRLGINPNGRKVWWNRAINLFKENPWFGVGLFGDNTQTYKGLQRMWWFHCTPLQILACFGIVGAILSLAYFFNKYYLFLNNRSFANFYIFGIILMIGLHGMIDISPYNADIAVLTFMLLAVAESDPGAKKLRNKNGQEFKLYRDCIKRVLDFCIALGGIIVFSPIMITVAIVSRIKIGKPVLFAQPRPGKNCKAFVLYKFRSMKNAFDKNGNPLPDEQRITKWGKFLRKSSFDEFPQLFNVLKGDMSIVGPRPRMIKDMVFYSSEVLSYYTIRPGITGFDQVHGRNKNSWERIFELDKEYKDKCSFWLDVKLFFLTFRAIFSGTGSAAGSVSSEREYWYPDYLLKNNMIENGKYEQGIKLAREIEQVTLEGAHVDVKEQCEKQMQTNRQN